MSTHDKLRDFLLCFDRDGNRSTVLAHLAMRIKDDKFKDEADVSTIIGYVKLPQPVVSQVLKDLRSNNIVIPRRAGKHIFYKLNKPLFRFYENLIDLAEMELMV